MLDDVEFENMLLRASRFRENVLIRLFRYAQGTPQLDESERGRRGLLSAYKRARASARRIRTPCGTT